MLYGLLESAAKIAPLGTFCVALTAIIVAMRQLRTVRQNEAMKQYLSYLDDCMKYPKLAVGDYDKNLEIYNQFLNKALWTHESILREFQGDNEWYNATLRHLEQYFLNIINFEADFKDVGLETYSKDIQNLFQVVRNKHIIEQALKKQENDNG